MGLLVDIDFHDTEKLLHDILQDQKRFPVKKEKRISRQKHICPVFTDWVTESVKGGIKLCKWAFRWKVTDWCLEYYFEGIERLFQLK